MPEVKITSEDDAFLAIERYLQEGNFGGEVILEGWPKLTIRLVGDKFDATITPSVMRSFIELQNLVYKTYAIARYETEDTRKLSREEREELEITVKVEEGSSVFEVDFQELLLKLAEKAGESMSPELLAATVIGVGLIWAGRSAYTEYLNHRKEIRLAEVKKEEQRETLRSIQEASQEETKRTQILTALMIQQPKLEQVGRQAYDARTEMFRGFVSADQATVSGVTVSSDAAQEITTNARRKAIEKRLDGYYRIIRVDSSNPEEFRVKVRRHRTHTEFEAVLQDTSLDAEKKEILQFAEWERTLVFLSINAKILDDDIKQATILDAVRSDPVDDQ